MASSSSAGRRSGGPGWTPRFEPNPKRRVAQETSRQLAGAKPDEVRLTHPAQWGPVRRNVLLSAARQAGMGTNLVLIPSRSPRPRISPRSRGRSLGIGQVEGHVNQTLASKAASSAKSTDWSGGGLTGKLYVNDLGDGFGILMFTLNDKSVVGSMFTPLPKSVTEQPRRQNIADYFNEHVKPGSA